MDQLKWPVSVCGVSFPPNQAPQVFSRLVVPLRASGSITDGAPSGNCKVPLRKSSLGLSAFSVRGSTCANLYLRNSSWIWIWVILISNCYIFRRGIGHEVTNDPVFLFCATLLCQLAFRCRSVVSYLFIMYRPIVVLCTVSCHCVVSCWVWCTLNVQLGTANGN